MNTETRPPLPPFTHETALVKVQKAEEVWNSRDPERCEWFRSHGNEQWEFDEHGLMRRREASTNHVAILDAERKFRWARS